MPRPPNPFLHSIETLPVHRSIDLDIRCPFNRKHRRVIRFFAIRIVTFRALAPAPPKA